MLSIITAAPLYLLRFRISHSALTIAFMWSSRQGFPVDINSQRLFRTSAVNHTRGSSLKGNGSEMEMSSLRIFSAVRFCEKDSSPAFNHWNVSREFGHEVRACSKLSISPVLQLVQRELFTSRKILFCLSFVGRSWWSSFHRKLIDELDSPLSLARPQFRSQLHCGCRSSTLQRISSSLPSGDNSNNS